VATEKQSLGQILKELAQKIGNFYTDRINISFAPEKKDALLARLGGGLQSIGAFPVNKFITTDGYKFLLPGGEWVAFRASGTEPLIRCYIEAKSKANLRKLQSACRELLAG
jgi:phosphoglucomutase